MPMLSIICPEGAFVSFVVAFTISVPCWNGLELNRNQLATLGTYRNTKVARANASWRQGSNGAHRYTQISAVKPLLHSNVEDKLNVSIKSSKEHL